MRKTTILAMILMLAMLPAMAEGLLPSLSDVVGVEMPSLYDAIGRWPDAVEALPDGGSMETWQSVTDEQYTAFGNYLSEAGCEMVDYHTEGTAITMEIAKEGRSFTFSWDSVDGTAVLNYPAGTVDAAVKQAEDYYQSAMTFIQKADYENARSMLQSIRGYKDVERIIEDDENLAAVIAAHDQFLAQLTVGNYVSFGSYEQDNDDSNGAEPIEWLVLKNDGETAMLISRFGLDAKPYNTVGGKVTWETCTLREWLNNDFFNAVFSEEEQVKIVESMIQNSGNPKHGTEGGNDTTDKVFLLSIDEANSLFESDEARLCQATEYAEANGAWVSDKNGNSWWWLRSPGSNTYCAALVNAVGSVYYDSQGVNRGDGVVRPVVLLRLR